MERQDRLGVSWPDLPSEGWEEITEDSILENSLHRSVRIYSDLVEGMEGEEEVFHIEVDLNAVVRIGRTLFHKEGLVPKSATEMILTEILLDLNRSVAPLLIYKLRKVLEEKLV